MFYVPNDHTRQTRLLDRIYELTFSTLSSGRLAETASVCHKNRSFIISPPRHGALRAFCAVTFLPSFP